MRRLPFARLAVVCVFGFASVAFAASLPIKAPAASIAATNWTGWYAGINGGYAWGSNNDASNDACTQLAGQNMCSLYVARGGFPAIQIAWVHRRRADRI